MEEEEGKKWEEEKVSIPSQSSLNITLEGMQQCGTKNLTYPPFFLNGCGFGTSIPKSLFKTIFICKKKHETILQNFS